MFRNVRDLLLLRLVSSSWFERRQCIEHNIVKLLTQLRNYTTQSHYSQTYVSFVRHYKRPSILINCIGIPYLSLTGQATYFSGCRLFIHISAPYHVPTVFFYSVSVKYEPISITIGKHVLQKHLTKLCMKCPLHLKCVLALPWIVEVTDWAVIAVLTCTFQWHIESPQNTTGSYCLRSRQTCS